MCHHWDYDNAYERTDEPEIEAEPAEPERDEADEPGAREDDPLADVPLADD